MLTGMILLGAALLAPADTTPRKTVAAHRLDAGEAAPVIDGRLDDAVWARTPAAGDFVQQYPDAGRPSTHRAEARVAYDDGAVYVAIRAWDARPDSIASQLARRDASGIYSDWVHVVFDSFHDRRTAYRFGVTPRGLKKDVFHHSDGDEDLSWDAVWDVATATDAEGWTAEFRIPLSQLRFKPQEMAQTWGVNFARDLARREERSWWSPMTPGEPGFVSRLGTLTGLERLRSPRRLEVLPYTVASVTRAPGSDADPFFRETDPSAAFGADVKYGVSSDLTLTATINPDFGQVEADPSQVNLSAFESFFAEKRPFFVEGADIFQFGIGLGDGSSESLFYSRRIGRTPQRSVLPSADRPFVDAPGQTTILGAAKLTGKVGGGWSIGVLIALTAQEHSRVQRAGGGTEEVTSEPLTNYAVARARRESNAGRTSFGGVLTHTYRSLDGDEGLAFLPSNALTGGLDFRHRFGGGNWETSGYALSSLVQGDSLAVRRLQLSPQRYYQRPDAGHLDLRSDAEHLSGTAASFQVGKIGGGRYRGGVLGLYRSPGFEVNDLGFQREADKLEVAAYGRWFLFEPRGIFRRWDLGWNLYSGWTTGRERTFTGANVNGSLQLTSLWGAYGGLERGQGGLNPRALRGGPALSTAGAWSGWGGFYSDGRKRVSGGVETNWSAQDETDGGSFWIGPYVNVRPSSRLTLTVSPSMSWEREATQYVATLRPDGQPARYVFAGLDQTTAALTARLNYTFSPDLTLQLYAQPFIAAGEYDDFLEVSDPRGARFSDRFTPLDDATRQGLGNPDFNFKQFRSNAVLRWEYRPGSTVFVVWSQGRENYLADGSFRLGRDFGRLFGLDDAIDVPATNVLLVKFNYWLNL